MPFLASFGSSVAIMGHSGTLWYSHVAAINCATSRIEFKVSHIDEEGRLLSCQSLFD